MQCSMGRSTNDVYLSSASTLSSRFSSVVRHMVWHLPYTVHIAPFITGRYIEALWRTTSPTENLSLYLQHAIRICHTHTQTKSDDSRKNSELASCGTKKISMSNHSRYACCSTARQAGWARLADKIYMQGRGGGLTLLPLAQHTDTELGKPSSFLSGKRSKTHHF